ncbi:Hsp20 family protein [Rhodobacteraceae bacterium 2CG4]|uniref:Hsp20 family protein n=1 Tax=Halovulum marinum TaxID=2662447 RepID=A0A6L5YY28_9RHOB|nr:Hsp20/alpha crystallin family protein [Halovulum marinum]MSU88762.1 Hsp20 family protein [Halovulum marinum]
MLFPASAYLRGDPFDLMRRMTRELDRGHIPRTASAFPAVNVWQGPEAAAVTAELPGVESGDIDITVKDNVLTIAGQRRAPDAAEDATWHRRERRYGRFSRAIRLPFEADPENVEARLGDGVLQIVIGRREQDKPRRIEIRAA